MMRAQVSLMPTESKKLIAKAVVRMDVVKRAFAEGIIVLHPSSSTIFVAEELIGERPQTPVWVCGLIGPRGACMGLAAARLSAEHPQVGASHPEDFRGSWVIQGGKLSLGIGLRDLFERMGPKDVYIKGVNAIDTEGVVGVLIGNRVEGGTMGRVAAASRQKGFTLIFPVGLEKLIPVRIEEAAKEALKMQYEYSMGIACGLLPCKGTVVTEPRAIEILTGATAIPIAAGGLDGAEGSITLVIKGEKGQVREAIKFVELSKGAKLPPEASPASCEDCRSNICDFPVKAKPWA